MRSRTPLLRRADSRQPRLLLPFALYSALLMALVGAGMFVFVKRTATDRAERHVTDQAQLIADAVLNQAFAAGDFDAPVSPQRRTELNTFFANKVLDEDIVEAHVFGPTGRVVYSTEAGPFGEGIEDDPGEVTEIMSGGSIRELTYLDHEEEAQGGRAIEALVPIHLADGKPPVGILEIYHDYAPVAAEVRRTVTPLFGILVASLALLYAGLFPILMRVSRRLRRESSRNDHQARHDSLTELPNRRMFREELDRDVIHAREGGASLAVMLMDLDRFKEINDSLGHHQGDIVLREVADRLRRRLRGNDLVARLGGDEFAVILRDAPDEATVREIAAQIHNVLEQPVTVGEMNLVVDASVGVALAPQHGTDADVLIQRADMAMYAAKSSRTGFEIYDAELDETSAERLTLTSDLRRAFANGELVVHYQPKANLDGKVVGVEALVRWLHPTLGLIPPDRFVPLAEHSGLIRPLTMEVLRHSLAQLRAWTEQGLDLTIAVNLSPQHLLDTDLPADIERMVTEAGVRAERLELEITETSLMVNPKRAVGVLERLGEIGVRIAIDDFGTGYSSLQYLKQLPVNVLKIDRTFVAAMTESERDALIVRSTIDLSRNLGLEVVAEGVETAECWDALAALGCDLAQGFVLAHPMPGPELTDWLARNSGGRPLVAAAGPGDAGRG